MTDHTTYTKGEAARLPAITVQERVELEMNARRRDAEKRVNELEAENARLTTLLREARTEIYNYAHAYPGKRTPEEAASRAVAFIDKAMEEAK